MDNRTRTVLSLVTEEDLGILAKAGKADKQGAGKLLPTAGNGLDIGHYPESMHLNRMEGNIVSNGN